MIHDSTPDPQPWDVEEGCDQWFALPDSEPRSAAYRRLWAWLVIGLTSVATYVLLAVNDAPFLSVLPFLVLICVSIFACGTAGRRNRRFLP